MNNDPSFAALLASTQNMASQIAREQQGVVSQHSVPWAGEQEWQQQDQPVMQWAHQAGSSSGSSSDAPIDSVLRSASLDSDIMADLDMLLDDDFIEGTGNASMAEGERTRVDDQVKQIVNWTMSNGNALLCCGDMNSCAALYARGVMQLLALDLPTAQAHGLRTALQSTAASNANDRVWVLRSVFGSLQNSMNSDSPVAQPAKPMQFFGDSQCGALSSAGQPQDMTPQSAWYQQ